MSHNAPVSVDWAAFSPQQRATLVFVIEAERVLLIRKKRGLGAGKINAPGGRIEPGETPEACAVRECQEELGIVPLGLSHMGELSFQFVDGLSLHAHVFAATGYEGEPRETEEAVPLFVAKDAIPYEGMWADDALWVPLLLSNRGFVGRFVFDGDRMLTHELVEHARQPRP